jgi:hypothetical protein
MQDCHVQTVCIEQQIVIAAEIKTDSTDFGYLEPTVTQAGGARSGRNRRDAGGGGRRCRFWHQAHMENVVNRGIPVLIPPDAGKRKGATPGGDGGPYVFMRRVLETDLGKRLYRNAR